MNNTLNELIAFLERLAHILDVRDLPALAISVRRKAAEIRKTMELEPSDVS